MNNNNTTTTMGDIKVTYSTEMLSLFEYLNKPAGSDLGREVAQAAYAAKVPIGTHKVTTPRYTGRILKYPKSFLDEYFGKTTTAQTNTNNDHDDLPF